MEDATKNALLRNLPSIDELLVRPSLVSLLEGHPRPRTVLALRQAVREVRERLLSGNPRGFCDDDVRQALGALSVPRLRPVLNATGVVLHTNLGRAPLAAAAAERVKEIALGYCNLEYDLDEGERGSRYAPVVELLKDLTGAEDALVVNNCAAAVLLVLAALGQGREAVVSRGELVEIGGGFRVPEVMLQSGVRLVEVGTTNRTRLSDYAGAIGPDTALLVKVHRSNFALVGFTEEVPGGALAELGRGQGIPVYEDLGSGALVAPAGAGLEVEPTVRSVVSSGVDLISFSGDKLLGGPQAGIIVGKAPLLAAVKRHPLNRALRVDKMTVAALEATLELYRDGRVSEIPAVRLLAQPLEEIRVRAERLEKLLSDAGVEVRLLPTVGQVGGGAMPLSAPPSFGCALAVQSVEGVHVKLRNADPPVIARISDGELILDVRCLGDDDLGPVAAAVRKVIQDNPC